MNLAAEQTFRHGQWTRIKPLLRLALALTIIILTVYWNQTSESSFTGLMLGPVILWLLVCFCIVQAAALWKVMESVQIHSDRLELHRLGLRKSIQWDEIADFERTPGLFGEPFRALELIARDGTDISVPRTAHRFADLVTLIASRSALDIDLRDEEVRLIATREPKRRRRKNRTPVIAILVASAPIIVPATAFMVYLCANIVVDWVHYRHLTRSGLETQGKITAIRKSRDSTYLWYAFTANGREYRNARMVSGFKLGDAGKGEMVTVQYLSQRPEVNRLKILDRDSRQPIMLLIYVPVVWYLLAALTAIFA